jgi:hypothetical protein
MSNRWTDTAAGRNGGRAGRTDCSSLYLDHGLPSHRGIVYLRFSIDRRRWPEPPSTSLLNGD